VAAIPFRPCPPAPADLAKPTLSGHFRVLKQAGLIQGDRNGTSITYHLNVSLLEEALGALLDLLGVTAGEQEET